MGRQKKPKVFDPETARFPERLKEIVGGNIRDFSRRCGVSDAMIGDYLRGESQPGLSALVQMARAGNVSVDWLAWGKGKKEPRTAYGSYPECQDVAIYVHEEPIDIDLVFRDGGFLEESIQAVEVAISNTNASLSPHKKTRMIKLLCQWQKENGRKDLVTTATELLSLLDDTK